MTKPSNHLTFLLIFLLGGFLGACSGVGATSTSTPTPFVLPEPTPNPYVDTFDTLWTTVESRYIYAEVLENELQLLKDQFQLKVLAMVSGDEFASLIPEMLAEFPENTVGWQSRTERLESELASGENTYGGIGAFVSFRAEPEPHVVLLEVMTGSPADAAGLKDRDSIYAVDNFAVSLEEGLDVIQRVRGPEGSDVLLRVASPGEAPRDVVVTRAQVAPQPKRMAMHFIEGTNILYAEFPRIAYGEMGLDFFAMYQALAETKAIQGIIIDLRVSSGTGWPLTQLLTMFTNGVVGETVTIEGNIPANIVGEDYFDSQDIPIVILAGPDTLGQAEIFTASMQINTRATVMGLPTPGLIEGSESVPLPDGSILTLATVSYVPADNRQIGILGVQPDIRNEAYWETLDPENDLVVGAALEYLLER